MGGLAHYLEDEGIPTVGISLIREHTEKMRPPRALVVPFELGRPFGTPDEPDFQRDVLKSALNLLTREDGPIILEDYPNTAPGDNSDMEGWACPVNFSTPTEDLSDAQIVQQSLEREIALLKPWYNEAVKTFRRSAFGISGKSPEEIAGVLANYLTDPHGTPAPIYDLSKSLGLKRCIDDLRYFYSEAAIAKPDSRVSDLAVSDWLWGATTLGKVMISIRNQMLDMANATDNAGLKRLATTALVPSHQRWRTKHG